MSTRCVVITADTDWICPDDVTAVFAMQVGGGAGAWGAGDSFSFHGASGGGGAAEIMHGRPITTVPGDTYSVVIGNKGASLTYGGSVAVGTFPAGTSSFNNFKALPGQYASGNGQGNCGGGGGPGGSPGGLDGGGFIPTGIREACHFSGGASGSFASFYQGFHSPSGGVQGGQRGLTGIDVGGSGDFGHSAGGAGGGTIFGGNTGGNSRTTPPEGVSTAYGAGAGGAGEPQSGTISGGQGSPGVVILMYAKP